MRVLLSAAMLFGCACAPRSDLFVAWTVGGRAPEACEAFEGSEVVLHVHNHDAPHSAVVEESTSSACADGVATLQVGPRADVRAELVSGGEVFGAAHWELSPEAPLDAGQSAEAPLRFDLALEQGRLRARLTVLGQSCGDAGVASFAVRLLRSADPLAYDVVAEETVACEAGDAVFSFVPVALGTHYALVAAADGSESGGTSGRAGFSGSTILTEITLDLERAAEEDE